MNPAAPDVQRLAPGVLLIQGRALLALDSMARSAVRDTLHRDGIRPGAALGVLLEMLSTAANDVRADIADVREEADVTRSNQERLTSREAADMLGITERQTRRLATELQGHRGPHGWTFDPDIIRAAHTTRLQRNAA